MDLNYLGTLRAIKAVVEPMVRRRKGNVIIVGSALYARPGASALLAQAAKILKEHLTVFINFEEEPEDLDDEPSEIEETLRQNLEKHVEELELSVRSLSVLKSLEIEFVADLVKRTEEELKKSRHYSHQCVDEIKQKLTEMNLGFGMRDFFATRD